MKLDIKQRLMLLAHGDNLDLVDIVHADAIARIEALEAALWEVLDAHNKHDADEVARAALAPEQDK
jgi:hypothetical protein